MCARVRVTAANTASDLVALHCDAPSTLTTPRAAAPRAGASDAGPIAHAVAARFVPWPDAQALDTTLPIEATQRVAMAAVGPV
jgi:predicted kinase